MKADPFEAGSVDVSNAIALLEKRNISLHLADSASLERLTELDA